jgi:hypothetical protein
MSSSRHTNEVNSLLPPRQRKGRIESTFAIEHPGDAPLPVGAGPCRVQELGGQVALHVGREANARVLMISNAQFQRLLDERRFVFVSW